METLQYQTVRRTTRPRNADRWVWLLAAPALVLGLLAAARFVQLNSIDARFYRAAMAAAQEAASPRASRTSVALSAQRALARENCTGISPNIELRINARPAMSHWIDCRSGDVISVTISSDRRLLAPEPLRWLGLRLPELPLRVVAILQKP